MTSHNRITAAFACVSAALAISAAHAQSTGRPTVRYTIRTGDTLLGLTARYLIGASAYDDLVAANNVADPERISPGQVIIVPVRLLRSAPLQATIASFKGAVSIDTANAVNPARVGMTIRQGNVVTTGADGFVTIGLSNGSRMTLPTKSRVRIVHMRQFLLTKSTDFDILVEGGRTEMSVTPSRDSNNLFRLRTPIAVSAVRGTNFRIGYDGLTSPSLTEVLDGKVAVDGPGDGAATSLVPAGFGAAAAASGKVGTEELLPAPVITDTDKIWKTNMLAFDLVPVATAQSYHLQLATDAQFQNMVAEARSMNTRLTVGALADGNYFARAMAVAPSGLEGLSKTYAISRVLAPLFVSVTAVDRRAHLFRWETDGRGGPVFRFQLFSQTDNAVPIIDETGMTSYSMTVDGLSPGSYSWRIGMRRVLDGKMNEVWTESEILTISSKGK